MVHRTHTTAPKQPGVTMLKRIPTPKNTIVLLIFALLVGIGIAVTWTNLRSSGERVVQETLVQTVPTVAPTVLVQEIRVQTVSTVAPIVIAQETESDIPKVLIKSLAEMKVEHIGTAWIGAKVKTIQNPTSDSYFVSGVALKEKFNFFTDHASGYTDGTVIGVTVDPENYGGKMEIYVSPDMGKTWIETENSLSGEGRIGGSIEDYLKIGGASIQEDTIILFLVTQPEPMLLSYWRVEILLKGLGE